MSTLLNPRVLVGLIISGICLYFVIQQVDVQELGTTLQHTDKFLAAITLIILPPSMVLKAARWRLFFPDYAAAKLNSLVAALHIGYMVNTIAPLRMGELVRAYLVGHHDRLGVGTSVATILLEKLFDVGTLILVFVVLAATTTLPDWANAAAIASGTMLTIGIIGTVCLLLAERQVMAMLGFFEKHIPLLGRLHLIDLAHSFVDGLRAIQSPRTLFWSVAWSAVLWLGGAAGLATGVAAVGIPITAPMIFFLMVVSNLGMAVPSAPGYVGVYHALVIAGLTPFGVPQTAALSAGIVIHAVVFGYFLLGGLVYLWLGRFSLSQLISGARESEHGP